MVVTRQAPQFVTSVGTDRARAHFLDSCLEALESAHERGLSLAPAEVASRFRDFVPGLEPGIAIPVALDLVFQAQRLYLQAATKPSQVDTQSQIGFGKPLGPDEARRLTERIKLQAREVSLLLFEAHERRAWLALRYRTWDLYVEREIGFSRSRAYELLDHARVLQALRGAARLMSFPTLSPYAARQIKAHLEEITADIRQRIGSCNSEQQAHDLIGSVVQKVRERASERSGSSVIKPTNPEPSLRNEFALPEGSTQTVPIDDVELLSHALACLGQMSSAPEALAESPEADKLIEDIRAAIRWLVDLECVWTRRRAA